MPIAIRSAFLTLCLAASVACDDGIVGSSTVTGSYPLRTVNGAALPYVLSQSQSPNGAVRVELIDDVITLYQGGTYQATAKQRTYVANVVRGDSSVVTAGTYGLLGTSITLIVADRSAQRIGMINANTMTFVENGITMSYRK